MATLPHRAMLFSIVPPTSENPLRQQNSPQNVLHQHNVSSKILCVRRISKTFAHFSLQNFVWYYHKAYFKFCQGMSDILFPLDTTLWQQYHKVLGSNFLARIYVMSIVFLTSQNTKTAKLQEIV